MATASAGKVTVLVVDEEVRNCLHVFLATSAGCLVQYPGCCCWPIASQGTRASKPGVRIENISWHFKNSCDGFENYTILEKDIQTPAALLIGTKHYEAGGACPGACRWCSPAKLIYLIMDSESAWSITHA